MNIKEVIFYNKAHVGDLHLTRSYVRNFPKWFDIPFSYLHKHKPEVLKDVSITHINNIKLLDSLPHEGSFIFDDERGILYLNTWVYSCGNFAFCTFKSGEQLMRNYFELLSKHSPPNIPGLPSLPPSIDYIAAGVDISKILSNAPNSRSIFICNNYVRNNQAYNDNMNFFIERLVSELGITAYLTNRISPYISHEKVVYLESLLNIENTFSMNALSYYSTLCPVIIGRGSGPFTFAEVVENLSKIWISMTFPHVACDVFNGLHAYSTNGKFFHAQDEDAIISMLKMII